MTDATAQLIIKERFGPMACGQKYPAGSGTPRIIIRLVISQSYSTGIGGGPTWEHAINEALAWKAKQR